MASAPCDYHVKLLLIGDSGVGKSSLLLRFADNQFDSTFIQTIGIDFRIREAKIKDKTVRIQVWDTAGQERFRTITTSYYRNAMGIMLLYDITDPLSFQHVNEWMAAIKQYAVENVSRFLVGNKCDMNDKRVISFDEGKRLADEFGVQFAETSAKDGTNIDQVFLSITQEIIGRIQASTPSAGMGSPGGEDSGAIATGSGAGGSSSSSSSSSTTGGGGVTSDGRTVDLTQEEKPHKKTKCCSSISFRH